MKNMFIYIGTVLKNICNYSKNITMYVINRVKSKIFEIKKDGWKVTIKKFLLLILISLSIRIAIYIICGYVAIDLLDVKVWFLNILAPRSYTTCHITPPSDTQKWLKDILNSPRGDNTGNINQDNMPSGDINQASINQPTSSQAIDSPMNFLDPMTRDLSRIFKEVDLNLINKDTYPKGFIEFQINNQSRYALKSNPAINLLDSAKNYYIKDPSCSLKFRKEDIYVRIVKFDNSNHLTLTLTRRTHMDTLLHMDLTVPETNINNFESNIKNEMKRLYNIDSHNIKFPKHAAIIESSGYVEAFEKLKK